MMLSGLFIVAMGHVIVTMEIIFHSGEFTDDSTRRTIGSGHIVEASAMESSFELVL